MFLGLIVFMAMFIKCCAVHTPSSNPRQPPARKLTLPRRHIQRPQPINPSTHVSSSPILIIHSQPLQFQSSCRSLWVLHLPIRPPRTTPAFNPNRGNEGLLHHHRDEIRDDRRQGGRGRTTADMILKLSTTGVETREGVCFVLLCYPCFCIRVFVPKNSVPISLSNRQIMPANQKDVDRAND